MKKYTIVIILMVMILNNIQAQSIDLLLNSGTKNFCYTLASGKYELSLEEGSDNKSYYKLYNINGNLVKTMQGIWEIRDEGIYGSVHTLSIKWSGINANLPDLKFTCQFDANGALQQLVDSQKRNWSFCH